MIEVINSYHVDYYIRNKIIDCSQVLANNKIAPQESDDSDKVCLNDLLELEQYWEQSKNLQSKEIIQEEERRNSYDMQQNTTFRENNKIKINIIPSINYIPTDENNFGKKYKDSFPKNENYFGKKYKDSLPKKEVDNFGKKYKKSLPKKK